MKRLLLIVAAMFCALATARAVPVTPATIPHVTFVNASGGPCAGCSLYTYAAGTTTPIATYTDAAGGSVNTNPIILDAAGGANIWVGRNSYKFILKDASGNTIWTVDQVNAGNLFPCGPANSVQISNSTVTGLNCDGNIFIDPINHTLNVGILPSNHVTIGAVTPASAVSWTMDTTTPATTCASIGCGGVNSGTLNQIAYYQTAGTTVSGTSAIPNGITATTQTPGDNSTKVATTAYVALPGAINPASVQLASGIAMVGNQGNGTLLQHSTGATTTGDGAKFDANGNIVDAGLPYPTGTPRTCNSNGCYQIDGDGTIRQWGVAPGIAGGGTESVTFPTTFTTTTNLTVVTGTGNGAGNILTKAASITTSGFTAGIGGVVFVGGSGSTPTGSETIQWIAVGK